MMGKYYNLRKRDSKIGINAKIGNGNINLFFPPSCIVEADYLMSSVIVEALSRETC